MTCAQVTRYALDATRSTTKAVPALGLSSSRLVTSKTEFSNIWAVSRGARR
jgi:hypothetical protein